MEQDKNKCICRKCGKAIEEDKAYCEGCLLDMKLDAEIAEFEKQIES